MAKGRMRMAWTERRRRPPRESRRAMPRARRVVKATLRATKTRVLRMEARTSPSVRARAKLSRPMKGPGRGERVRFQVRKARTRE